MMTSEAAVKPQPLIKEATTAKNEIVNSVLQMLDKKRYYIPNYQRDSDQWDERKESLFIESILNNLTIPGFFLCPTDQGYEVVDGQQRLTTLQKFKSQKMRLSEDASINYLPQGANYIGKTYDELPQALKDVFDEYPLPIIQLPANLDIPTRLEIFRRINEAGTPLTGQDIRLAYYSASDSVMFLRLAGIYSQTQSAARMLQAASERGMSNPWDEFPKENQEWTKWWKEKEKAKGQTPSEMFLWFLVQRYRDKLNNLVSGHGRHLQVTFRGTTEEVLDAFCSQLEYSDKNQEQVSVLPTLREEKGLKEEFKFFATRFQRLIANFPGLYVQSYKSLALFIGVATELQIDLANLSEDATNAVSEFIRSPRNSGERWLKSKGLSYPEPKGRWGGDKGQFAQCNAAVRVVSEIMSAHPPIS